MTLKNNHDLVDENSLALVGMAGQFPDAPNITQFWQNLVNGLQSSRFFSDEELLAAGVSQQLLNDPSYVKADILLEDIDVFDATFFGFTPREAETIDPQTRLFLQCAWKTLEDAAYDPGRYEGHIGVFVGKHPSNYRDYNLNSNPELVELVGKLQLSSGNDADALATMVAYKLDLQGPTVFCAEFLFHLFGRCSPSLSKSVIL